MTWSEQHVNKTTAASSDGAAPSNDQTAAAVAFKDRLVDYDRNARQRTTVVDDQNDFFEIDTNAWLEPEVGYFCTGLRGSLDLPVLKFWSAT